MAFALAANGTLVYVPDNSASYRERVVWVDRKGQTVPAMDNVDFWVQPRLSPDGARILLRKLETNCELWTYDLQRRVLARLAYGNDNHNPLWMPDGKSVVFDIPNGAVHGLVWHAADGSGPVRALVQQPEDFEPTSWSGDGRLLALTLFAQSNRQIWVWDKNRPPTPFHENNFDEEWGSFSPGGDYFAYDSDQSGRFEVYVSPFPGPGAVTQVSAGGGLNPLWSRDGRELFYQAGTKMMSVKLITQPHLAIGVAQELFRSSFDPDYRRSFGREYDVSADGKRFLMLEPAGQAPAPPDLHVIVSFAADLRRLVSAGGL